MRRREDIGLKRGSETWEVLKWSFEALRPGKF